MPFFTMHLLDACKCFQMLLPCFTMFAFKRQLDQSETIHQAVTYGMWSLEKSKVMSVHRVTGHLYCKGLGAGV